MTTLNKSTDSSCLNSSTRRQGSSFVFVVEMTPSQKRSKTTTAVRRSSRVAARQGWRIPLEILLLIMEQLYDSPDVLRTASLVCRAWRGPAQVYLFSQVTLESKEDCKKLLKVLNKSPHIAQNVHRLNLIELGDPSLPTFRLLSRQLKGLLPHSKSPYLGTTLAVDLAEMLGSSILELGTSIYPFGSHIIPFLKPLTRVRTFKLCDCEDMPLESFSEVLKGMTELNSLHLLCGESFADPDKYLDNVEALSRSSSSVESQDVVSSPIRLNTLALDKIEHRFDIIKFLLDSGRFDLENLESLYLAWMEVEDQAEIEFLDFRLVDRLFERVGPSVKDLKFGLTGGTGDNAPDRYLQHLTLDTTNTSLSHLTAVESLTIDCKITSYYGFDPSPYISLLAALPSSTLTTLTIDAYVDVKVFPEHESQYFNEHLADADSDSDPRSNSAPGRAAGSGPNPTSTSVSTWQALDNLLSSSTLFPSLRSVRVIAKIEYDPTMVNYLGFNGDVQGCGSPGCMYCTSTAIMHAQERTGARKNEEGKVRKSCEMLEGWFERALVGLRERGMVKVEVEKVNRCEEFKDMRAYGINFQWDGGAFI
ncbi:hypothetical protein D9758_018750 [Tetrapyrgos nigripes]|uniref:F-box domain-containing protein n=1 Tax=Tetrapyrgos nigripes TaxID=182062 RepID=A0A8H5EZ73_9AGAR|nr:hypothetical protein D9758_018750 [Tetrapyrgos nigripes]